MHCLNAKNLQGEKLNKNESVSMVDKITVRIAKETDDKLRISKCIFFTDPFIYPAAFGEDVNNAALAISKLMNIDNGIFNIKNILIAISNEEICGILLFNRKGLKWDSNQCLEIIRNIIPSIDDFNCASNKYFMEVSKKPEKKHIEIIACCVMPEFRNLGVGGIMLESLFNKYPGYNFTLDVLADNFFAIHLYEKHGFKIEKKIKGFNIEETSKPDCYHMIR